ncbi:MAG: hypothetical protein AB7I38_14605 [Dehalococcoidia bacterium]
MASLGRCLVGVLVAEGSDPQAVEVYTTTWRLIGEATGAGPGDGALDEAVYFLWVTGDLEPLGGSSAVSPPRDLGGLIGQWLVEPIARPADGPPCCAGNYAGGANAAMPAALTLLGAPTVMPAAYYTVTAAHSS